MRGLPTACTTPATDDMKVTTKSPQLQELRKAFLELILTEHPNACLTCHRRERCKPNDICLREVAVSERCVSCPNNHQCELQDLVDYIGIGEELTLPYHYKNLPVDLDREPLIQRDYNLCILCGRCVQVCQDVRGIGAIGWAKHGYDTVVGTAFDRPLQDSGCRFCGACVEVCPTGALMDAAAAFKPDKNWEEVAVPCQHACPAHEGYTIKKSRDWLKKRAPEWKKGINYDFGIFDAKDGTLIGGCGLNSISRLTLHANLGYWVRTSRMGQGVAPAATRLLAKWGFEALKLNRIEILVAVGNERSLRTALKAGAAREGVLRNRLPVNGKVRDAVMHSLIPADFKA